MMPMDIHPPTRPEARPMLAQERTVTLAAHGGGVEENGNAVRPARCAAGETPRDIGGATAKVLAGLGA